MAVRKIILNAALDIVKRSEILHWGSERGVVFVGPEPVRVILHNDYDSLKTLVNIEGTSMTSETEMLMRLKWE